MASDKKIILAIDQPPTQSADNEIKIMASPNGTLIQLNPVASLTDETGGVWTLAPDGKVLLDGAQAGNGRGVAIAKSGGRIYVLGNDALNWWMWDGEGNYSHEGTSPPAGVVQPNPPPLAEPPPVRLLALPGASIKLEGTPSSPNVKLIGAGNAADGQPIPEAEWKWTLTNPVGVKTNFTGREKQLTGLTPDGLYKVRLDVLNGSPERDFNVITNSPTVVTPKFTATPGLFGDPLRVQFDASTSTAPLGAIQSHGWQFGDGDTRSGVNPMKLYASGGVYSVTLTLRGMGNVALGTLTKPVTVGTAPPTLPPVPTPTPGPVTNPLNLTTADVATTHPSGRKITTAGTVVQNTRFVDPRQVNRLMDSSQASQNARPVLDFQAINGKVLNCVFENCGHPNIGAWGGSNGLEAVFCIAHNYGVLDNTDPNGSDDVKKMGERGNFLYGQSLTHDDKKFFHCCVSYGGFNQSAHLYSQSKFVSGFQFLDGAAFSPGKSEAFIFLCPSAIKGTVFQRYSIFIDDPASEENEMSGIKFWPSDIFPDGTSSILPLTENVIVNLTGPCIQAQATSLIGDRNVLYSRKHPLIKLKTGNLTRDPMRMANNKYYDPEGRGFDLNGPVGWDEWKSRTGDSGTYSQTVPPNQVQIGVHPAFPGRSLVKVWNFNGATSASFVLVGLTSGQKYAVIDTQNIDGPALATGTFGAQNLIITVPLPAPNAPMNPKKGTVPNPFGRSNILVPLLVVPIA